MNEPGSERHWNSGARNGPAARGAWRIGMRMEQHEREGGKLKTKRIRVCKKCGADIPERRS